MIILHSVTVTGFRSIKDPVTLDLTPGVFLIRGRRGAGKTTLFREAIFWMLFGTNLRGQTIDNIVNRDAKEAKVVGQFFIDGVGDAVLTRTRGKKGGQTTTFIANGQDLLASAGATQSSLLDPIERILGTSAATIRATSFYTPASGFMAMGDADRRELLEDSFGLSWIRDARDKVVVAHKVAAAETYKVRETLAYNQARVDTLTGAVVSLKEQIESAESRAVVNNQAELARLSAEMRKMTEEHREAHAAYASVEQSLAGEEKALADFRTLLSTASRALVATKGKQEAALRRFTDLGKAVQRAEESLACLLEPRPSCPTCHREFSVSDDPAKVERELRRTLDDRKADVARCSQTLDVLYGALIALNQRHADAVRDVQNAEARIDRSALTRHAAIIARLEAGLRTHGMTIQRLTTEQFNSGRDDAAVLALTTNLTDTETQLAQATRTLASANESMVACNKREMILAWWKTAFGPKGIRAFILESTLPALSRLASWYLGRMSGYQLTMEITPTTTNKKGVESETINVTVHNIAGIDSALDLSTGEQRCVDLSITLALADLALARSGRGLSYAVLDEALDCLQEANREPVVAVIRDVASRGMTIGIITHADVPVDRVCTVARGETGWTVATSSADGKVGAQDSQAVEA